MQVERIIAELDNGKHYEGWLVAREEWHQRMQAMAEEGVVEGYEPKWKDFLVLLDDGHSFCKDGPYGQKAIGRKLKNFDPAEKEVFSDGRLPEPKPDMNFIEKAKEALLHSR